MFPKKIDNIIYNAIKQREEKSKIDNKITILPEFRSIFEDKQAICGNNGKIIDRLRTNHKS